MSHPPELDLLADLDAGLLAPPLAERVRSAALADPRSVDVLDALAATRADLGRLGDPPVPPHLAGRWDAALDEAARAGTDDAAPSDGRPSRTSAGARSTELREGRSRPRPGRTHPGRTRPGRTRPGRTRRGRLLASLAVAAAIVAAVLTVEATDDRPSVTRVELAAAARSSFGLDDLGELTDPAQRAACLAAVGQPDGQVAGGRRVQLEGEPGVLLVLTTGVLGRFQVLVVDPQCGRAGGSVLAELVIGA